MKRQTSHINKRGHTEWLRSCGFKVYRYYKDVPPTLATATSLKGRGLRVADDTRIVDYVLSGDGSRTYCLFSADDPTLKPVKSRQVSEHSNDAP